jgi:NhaA family Na+:H+ antiporter
MPSRLKSFIDSEVASALPLLAATVLALILANSPWHQGVERLLDLKLGFELGPVGDHVVGVKKSVLLWINDGLMALFFLLVGIEIKREIAVGELSTPAQRALPVLGALGGMAVPAAIYVAFNWGDAVALRGWAIPSATDIAFSLGVLAILGSRVPASLKVFLTTLAIVDDLGAIVIIAAFYTSNLSGLALGAAAVCLGLLLAFNRLGVTRLLPYFLVGAVLWVAVLKSGVHATLAGVVLAMIIPLKPGARVEHALKPWSAWFIMPVFAFANARLAVGDLTLAMMGHGVTLGVVAGLFFGKQIGVLAGAGLPILLGWAKMPAGATWRGIYGVAILAGIGFTMSLFIGTLAFDGDYHETEVRLGVLVGSLLSAVVGWLVFRLAPKAG